MSWSAKATRAGSPTPGNMCSDSKAILSLSALDEPLAAAVAEERETLEDVVEPYLIQEGLMLRTSRGRMLGEPGWRHLGLKPPRAPMTNTPRRQVPARAVSANATLTI